MRQPSVSILSQISPCLEFSIGGSILKLSSHLHLGLNSGLFPSGTTTEPLNPHTCHMPYPFLSTSFYPSYNTGREAQIVMYITWFSSFTCYYLHLGLKYFLNTVFSNNFGLCWSHNVRDKLSHTYKREASYISLYLNFYIFGKQI